MTNKEIIKEVSKILKADEKEFCTELKGKTILVDKVSLISQIHN